MDIVSLGLWEVIFGIVEFTKGEDPFPCSQRTTDRVTIAYDDRDVILGIFDELAELPADGRSGPRKW